MLFGIPETKDATGSGGIDPAGVLNLAITDVVAEVGDQLTVMSDLCLDEFTDHGHCGLLTPDGDVDNDLTLAAYAEMALAQAAAGVDMVGPSGMMDGQVARGPRRRSTRPATTTSRSSPTPRSTPPRSSARSARPSTPRSSATAQTYQQDPANAVEGVREALLDVEQGADIVMVKPALRLPRRRSAACATPSTSRSRPTTSPASTPWSRPPPPTAGSTARPPSWRPSPRSAAPAPT